MARKRKTYRQATEQLFRIADKMFGYALLKNTEAAWKVFDRRKRRLGQLSQVRKLRTTSVYRELKIEKMVGMLSQMTTG